jgi:cytochrome c oxidase accessory protein FixG
MERCFLAKLPRGRWPIKSRPGVLDSSGSRIFQYPLEVSGYFRKRRDIVYSILIAIFLFLPWIKIGGVQSILLDIPGRQFSIFGLRFWAHDAPMLFFVFGGFALSLIFVTAIWGRVWCGWACPQTVFIDGVYRRIEAWVEGKAHQRKLLDQSDWNFEKIRKRVLKHILFLAVTLIITHSFLAYFVGSGNVLSMVLRPPGENWISFLFVLISTSILYFNFAWFREQFCIIMCPYGRLQSALFDSNTMIVGYDKARGDCIECKKCVYACPTGIDIRDGVQLECIACTACMDACDEIMAKVKKPPGLIKYSSEMELAGQKAPKVRPRTIAYGAFLLLLCLGFVITLSSRNPVDIHLIKTELQTKASPDQPSIFRYTLEFSNQTFAPKKMKLSPAVRAGVENFGFEFIMSTNPVTLMPGKIQRADFFLKLSDNSIELPEMVLDVVIEGEGHYRTIPLKK